MAMPLTLGRVRLEGPGNPGHTPESISILVYDVTESDTVPHAVLTGDTLVHRRRRTPGPPRRARLVGRRDSAGCSTTRCTPSCWRCRTEASSIPHTARARFAASRSAAQTVSTLGEQRRTNYALQPMTREAFVELVTADQPTPRRISTTTPC